MKGPFRMTLVWIGCFLICAVALSQQDQIDGEQQQIEAILAELERLGGGEEVLILLQSQISVARLQGDTPLAERYAQRLLDASRKSGDRPRMAAAQYYLAFAAEERGDLSRAIDLLEESLASLPEGDPLRAQAFLLLGATLQTVGDFPRAVEAFRKLETIGRAGDPKNLSLALLAQAGLGLIRGERSMVEKQLAESLSLAGSLGDRLVASEALMVRGLAAVLAQDHRGAIDSWQKMLELSRLPAPAAYAGEERRSEVIALNLLAYAHAGAGDGGRALELADKAVALADPESMEPERALALDARSFVHFRAGRLPEAEADARASIDLFDRLRSKIGNADLVRAGAFDEHSVPYDLLQKAFVRQGKPGEALIAAERGKARAFSEALEEHGERNVALDDLLQTARTLKTTLVEYSLLHDPGQYLLPQRLDGLQAQLEDELLIWVIRPDGDLSIRSVDLAALRQRNGGSLDGSIRLLLESLEAGQRTMAGELSRQLHDVLIAPIADLLPCDPQAPVVIVPHGALFLVPFPALLGPDKRFLIEKHVLLTMPSIDSLNRLKRVHAATTGAAAGVLIVGDPWTPLAASLPSAEKEALAVARQLGAEALVGERATEAEVVRAMPGARLIHIAGHGFLGRSTAGIPGALALAPSAPGEDGLLTASEIRSLRLAADLIVLSACRTGRGRLSGDGVIGLSRSFLLAGAAGVVTSLWPIDDEATATLMIDFHRQRAATGDPARALRSAMLGAIRRGESPSDWAAFSYLGAPK